MKPSIKNKDAFETINYVDEKLSKRFIALDPYGYFIIKVDHESNELVLEHYLNDIDEKGIAVDKESGKPIGCNRNFKRKPTNIYRSRSAKELGTKITEGNAPYPISRLDHALYIGRELQKAENCLIYGLSYVQD